MRRPAQLPSPPKRTEQESAPTRGADRADAAVVRRRATARGADAAAGADAAGGARAAGRADASGGADAAAGGARAAGGLASHLADAAADTVPADAASGAAEPAALTTLDVWRAARAR